MREHVPLTPSHWTTSMTNPTGDTSSVVLIPHSLAMAMVFTAVGIVGSGAWFMGAQNQSITTLAKQVETNRTEADNRNTASDANAKSRDTYASALDLRLARIEEQLNFIVKNGVRK